jgi:PAS domain S-box-containing protein
MRVKSPVPFLADELPEHKPIEKVITPMLGVDFRLVTDADEDGIVLFDADLRYLYLNPQAERFVNTNQETLLGRHVWDVFPHAQDTPVARALSAAVTKGASASIVHRSLLRPNEVWYETRIVPYGVTTVGVPVAGALCFTRDVTARFKAEADRERLLRETQGIMSHIAEGLVVVDTAGTILSFNPAALSLYGFTAEEVTGRSLAEFTAILRLHDADGNDVPLTDWPLARALRGETFSDLELRCERIDTGRAWHAAYSGSQVRDADGVLLMALITVRDITAQKRAEAERSSVVAWLGRSERRLRIALEAAAMVPWDWDLASLADPAHDLESARVDTGGDLFRDFPPEEHTAGRFLAMLHPEDAAAVRAAVIAALDASTAHPAPYQAEYRVRLPAVEDGWRWMAARGHIVRDPSTGRPLRLSGVRWEIDERKRLEAERADALARLTEYAARQERIAETLQRSLLLVPDGTAPPGWETIPLYEAASDEAMVGGDFFDIYPVDEHRTALVVGDVTGKGLGAATATAEVKFALRTLLRAHDADPAAALAALNRHLHTGRRVAGEEADALYVCLTLLVADARDTTVRIAIAGGEPPLFIPANAANSFPLPLPAVHGLLLGAWPTWEEDGTADPIPIGPGDTFLLFTDGITEARLPSGAHRPVFGPEGALRAAVAAAAEDASANTVGTSILAEARAHAGGSLHDDVCLLVARRRAA